MIQPFQQRVIDEKTELDDKLSKLTTFLGDPRYLSLPEDEQIRLSRQFCVMTEYTEILRERIAAFQ